MHPFMLFHRNSYLKGCMLSVIYILTTLVCVLFYPAIPT